MSLPFHVGLTMKVCAAPVDTANAFFSAPAQMGETVLDGKFSLKLEEYDHAHKLPFIGGCTFVIGILPDLALGNEFR
jgi:hypothetical protein